MTETNPYNPTKPATNESGGRWHNKSFPRLSPDYSPPDAAPPLAQPQALVVLVGPRGDVRALFTDAEDSRDLIPGHMLAESTAYRSAPIEAAPQIGQPDSRYPWAFPGASEVAST